MDDSSFGSDLSGGPPLSSHHDEGNGCGNNQNGCSDGWCEEPFSCMFDLIKTNPPNLTPEQRRAAFDAWAATTGFSAPDYVAVFDSMTHQQQAIVNFTSYYAYAPTLILSLIMIWLAVIFCWINWKTGLFFSVLAIVVLYGFSVLYRFTAKQWLSEQNKASASVALRLESQFENSIAFWPQGLFDVACAITKTGSPSAPTQISKRVASKLNRK